MINPVITLFKKELRQNGFIYFLPFVLITVAFFLQKTLSQTLSITWAKNFAIAIPAALAFSYAVQAFDLEENSQTWDFIFTKPVSVSQIVKAKFFSGLLVLLPIVVLWLLALAPDSICLPNLLDLSSFWFLGYLIFSVIIYCFSFTVAAWVNGPKKLLTALFLSACGVIWFFFGWSHLLTQFYLTSAVDNFFIVLSILVITFTLMYLLICSLLASIYNKLFNQPLTQLRNKLLAILLLLSFPLIFYLANLFYNPEIRPFNSLLDCLNGTEEPFFAVDIAKQPQGGLYALTDIRGRLGIAERGNVPTVIYQGEKDASSILSKIIWSPDGTRIAFNENGIIKVLTLSQKKPISIIKGDIPFWSPDSKVLLIAAVTGSHPIPGHIKPYNHYRLSYVTLDSKTVYELQGNLSFPGSSMFWNSSRNIILAVTDFWEIAVMNLNDGKIEMFKIPQPEKVGSVFLTKIAPFGNDSYRVAFFTDLKSPTANQGHFNYNAHLYDFQFNERNPVLKASLPDLKYQDILINAAENWIWASNPFGVYRKIKLP